MNREDAKNVDTKVSVDLFVYIFAVASKTRPDIEDDAAFMRRLQASLRSFREHKAVAAETLFSFDRGAGESSKLDKGETRGQNKKDRSMDPKVSFPIKTTL